MSAKKNPTLRQGLVQFYQENKGYLHHTQAETSKEAEAFFQSHDVAHVVFGCDISLFGEGAVKIWTIFGTTLGFWNHIRGYQEANAFELAKNFGFIHVVRNIFKFLLYIPVIIIKAKSMSKPWPWSAFEPYLDMPISELRKEFNIHVLGKKAIPNVRNSTQL